jgi:hypothetical protein
MLESQDKFNVQDIYVVKGLTKPLLGRPAIQALGLTLSISNNGTLRGTDNANGFASGYNAIVYVQFVFPSPLKMLGYLAR